jgi:hypothetical protein
MRWGKESTEYVNIPFLGLWMGRKNKSITILSLEVHEERRDGLFCKVGGDTVDGKSK